MFARGFGIIIKVRDECNDDFDRKLTIIKIGTDTTNLVVERMDLARILYY
jgi:hypothetical protein